MTYSELYHHYQTILVASYVKDVMLVAYIVRGWEVCFDIS